MQRKIRIGSGPVRGCLLCAAALLCLVWLCPLRTQAIGMMLRVAYQSDMPPYQFSGSDRENRGMHIELFDAIAADLNYTVEYLPMQTNSACFEALHNGEVDLVLGAILNPYVDYFPQCTEEISSSSICLIAPNDEAQLIRDRAMLQRFYTAFELGTINYSFMVNAGLPLYLVQPSQTAVFEALLNRRSTAVVGVKDSLLYQLRQAGVEDQYTIVYNNMASISYTVVTAPGDTYLREKINGSLARLQASGQYGEIVERWRVKDESASYRLLDLVREHRTAIFAAGSVILFFFLYNLRMNRTLRIQVDQKTAQLQLANRRLEYQIFQAQQETELRNQIIQNSPSAIVLFDISSSVTMFNQSARRIVSAGRLRTGGSVLEIQPFAAFLKEGKIRAALRGEKLLNQTAEQLDPDGKPVIYRYSVFPLRDYRRISGAVLSVEDITREIHERQAVVEREKNRVLNQLIAGIAHEIKNPLMSLKLLAQLIRGRREDEEFQESFAEIVPQEVDRINHLVESLIDYARPPRGQRSVVLVEETVQACMLLLNTLKESRAVEFVLQLQEGLTVYADPNQFRQILINIMLNGVEAIGQKTAREGPGENGRRPMTISSRREGEWACISITDSGIGMTPDEIRRATEPFYTTKPSGTGMGLAVTKQLIDENNGILEIQSEKNRYTTFTIRFRRQP